MNPTQPSDTPRTEAAVFESISREHSLRDIVRADFAREIERELNNWKKWHEQIRLGGQALALERDQWRACAEKLFEFGSHSPSCMYRSYLGPPPYPCDCGLNEAREMFEKLKGSK